MSAGPPPCRPLGRAILLAAVALGGCRPAALPGERLLTVSMIGTPLASAVPGTRPSTDAAQIALRGATGLGLIRFDQAGQLMPGIAIRWAIVEDGLDGIFRIDGAPAPVIARRLRQMLALPERRGLRDGIGSVAAVTDAVIEVRLTEPRSDLLTMLATPELAALDPRSGPFRAGRAGHGALLLSPRAMPGAPRLLLRGEPAGTGVARFAAGRADFVGGGTFADLAIARAADPPDGTLRFDRATGLFGFALRAANGPYADPPTLRALGLALDRDRIVALTGAPGAAKATTLGGSRIEPPLADRRALARAIVAGRALRPLRLGLPAGPGARLLLRLIAQDWGRIGVRVEAVAPGAPADLALIDLVLPPGEIARAACSAAAGCDPADKTALLAPPFIPLGSPLRWSLVAPRLDLFAENALAQHPLDRLVSPD